MKKRKVYHLFVIVNIHKEDKDGMMKQREIDKFYYDCHYGGV